MSGTDDDWTEDDLQKWTRQIQKDNREQRAREGMYTTLEMLQREHKERERDK